MIQEGLKKIINNFNSTLLYHVLQKILSFSGENPGILFYERWTDKMSYRFQRNRSFPSVKRNFRGCMKKTWSTSLNNHFGIVSSNCSTYVSCWAGGNPRFSYHSSFFCFVALRNHYDQLNSIYEKMAIKFLAVHSSCTVNKKYKSVIWQCDLQKVYMKFESEITTFQPLLYRV